MSVELKKETGEFVLSGDYEMNFIRLSTPEREHTHRFIEIVYTISGRGRHTVDEAEYTVKGGDLLVINYHSRHCVQPVENLYYVDIMLKPEYLNEALRGTEDLFLMLQLRDFKDLSNSVKRDNIFLSFDGKERKNLEFLIEMTKDEQKKRNMPASEAVIRSALTAILCMVFRKMAESRSAKPKIDGSMLEYIKRNCQNKILIAEIAEKCGYSPEHFSRLFKKYTGQTAISYITDCRIEKSKMMLAASEIPIESVISECGFTNRTAFFKIFRKYVGCTPLQYRKNQK